MNIEKCLHKYSDPYYEMFAIRQGVHAQESACKARAFLQKFAMDEVAYQKQCVPIQQKIFRGPVFHYNILVQDISKLFCNQAKIFAYLSSPLLWKENYTMFQNIGKACGEHSLFIIEDESCEEDPEQAFKLQIPLRTDWAELSDGGFISDVVLNMFHNNYCVFGESGYWGRWCNYENDWMDYEVFGYTRAFPEILTYKNWCAISNTEYKKLEKKDIPTTIKKWLCINPSR